MNQATKTQIIRRFDELWAASPGSEDDAIAIEKKVAKEFKTTWTKVEDVLLSRTDQTVTVVNL